MFQPSPLTHPCVHTIHGVMKNRQLVYAPRIGSKIFVSVFLREIASNLVKHEPKIWTNYS